MWNKSEIEGSEDCNITVPLEDVGDEVEDDEGEMIVEANITSPQAPIVEDPAWKELWKDVVTSKEHCKTGEHGYGSGKCRRHNHYGGISVFDVRQLMGHDGGELLLVQPA